MNTRRLCYAETLILNNAPGRKRPRLRLFGKGAWLWGRLVIANAAVLPPLTDALRPAVSAVVQNYLGQLCSSRTTGYSALARFLAQRLGRTELGVATYSFCPFFMW